MTIDRLARGRFGIGVFALQVGTRTTDRDPRGFGRFAKQIDRRFLD